MTIYKVTPAYGKGPVVHYANEKKALEAIDTWVEAWHGTFGYETPQAMKDSKYFKSCIRMDKIEVVE